MNGEAYFFTQRTDLPVGPPIDISGWESVGYVTEDDLTAFVERTDPGRSNDLRELFTTGKTGALTFTLQPPLDPVLLDLFYGRNLRCDCCDLPTYSCGTAAIRKLRQEDEAFAAWLETPEGARA